MGTGGSFPGVNWPGNEADHSPPTSAEVKKNVDLYIHSPICLHGVVTEKECAVCNAGNKFLKIVWMKHML
jgi:hypothetical protein